MDTIHQLAEDALSTGSRVTNFEYLDAKYWVKQVQERGLFLRIQKGPAEQLLNAEISCFKAFKAKGILVPELVLETDRFFVSKDIGVPLDTVLLQSKSDHKNLLINAAKAVAKMHMAGLAHGGLHMRNMCISDKIGFIDLEKGTVINTKIDAQVYDIVVFVWSMLSIDINAAQNLSAARNAYLEHGSEEIWQKAVIWAKRKNWLRYAAKPLFWHEQKFRQHKPLKRYAAVPAALDFLQN